MNQTDSYLSEEEVSIRLQEIETAHELLRYQHKGWCIWPLFRFSVSRRLQNIPLDAGGPVVSRREQLSFALKDLWCLARLRRARFAVKTYSSAHMEFEGGRKKDVFFDDLIRVVGDNCKIESLNSRSFHSNPAPYLVPPDISTAALNVLTYQLGRRRPPPGLQESAIALSGCLQRELGFQDYTPSYVAAVVAQFCWSRRLFRLLWRRIRPEYLLVADTGEYPATAAARELGIKVVEFQHGFTHRYFPGNSWSCAALPFKSNMALPHRIFLYGPHWQRALAANGFWNDELRAVGSMRVDNYRRQTVVRNDDVCTMVLTTQGTDTDRLVAFVAEFLRLLDARIKYCLYFKMHPTYHGSQELFESCFGRNPAVRLLGGSEPPSTFALLKQAHLHLSIYSTCHYEALALGVPTVILPLTGYENVMHLHAAGHAFMPKTPADLVDIALRWREHRAPMEVGSEYFTPGALENVQRELAGLHSAH